MSLRLRLDPLRGLNPDRLVTDLDQFRLGFFRNIALTWDAMERRDDRLQAVAAKRKKSVARHGWEILATDASPDAQRQKAVLESFYNRLTATTALEPDESGGMSLLLRQMMDAVGKRYAVHEIVWRVNPHAGPGESALGARFVFCPLWWFEGRRGRVRYLANEMAVDGADLEPNGWLVTVGDGIMEACSVAYMFKHLPLRDWLAYSGKFGFPGLLAETPAPKDSPEWEAMVEAVRDFSNDWAAVVNEGAKLTLVEAGGSGAAPFQPLVQMMNEAMTVLWRGGDLGTASRKQAVGATLQESETDILDLDDAQLMGETLTNQVSRFVLQYHFGDAPQLAYLKIRTAEKTHVIADLQVDQFLLQAGAPLGVQAALERYNRSRPAQDDELLRAPSPNGSSRGDEAQTPPGREESATPQIAHAKPCSKSY